MAEITLENVHESMIYHAPDEAQKVAHGKIADGAEVFARIILENAPRCADRSVALRKVREARMDANSAIANRGGF